MAIEQLFVCCALDDLHDSLLAFEKAKLKFAVAEFVRDSTPSIKLLKKHFPEIGLHSFRMMVIITSIKKALHRRESGIKKIDRRKIDKILLTNLLHFTHYF